MSFSDWATIDLFELTLFELMHKEISINVLPNQNRLAGHFTDCKRVSNGQMSGRDGNTKSLVSSAYQSSLSDFL